MRLLPEGRLRMQLLPEVGLRVQLLPEEVLRVRLLPALGRRPMLVRRLFERPLPLSDLNVRRLSERVSTHAPLTSDVLPEGRFPRRCFLRVLLSSELLSTRLIVRFRVQRLSDLLLSSELL